MRKIIFIVSIVIILVIVYLALSKTKSENFVKASVVKIVDGDTIKLSNGDVVRLIGIDAPEKDQPLFEEVNNELEKLLWKTVSLEMDSTNKDSYGRLLRYIFFEDHFVNLELVRSGLASAYIVEPDTKYASDFISAENYARENKLGIWDESNFSSCIKIEDFHYNAKGNDAENMNDEYVIFSNNCNFKINFYSWTIKDLQGNQYKFSKLLLEPNTRLAIFSGSGNNTENKIYWNSKYPIWNNDEDAITLRDSDGRLVIYEKYQNNFQKR